MHCQVLSSGSGGNALLVRAGELRVLVDAGLPLRLLRQRIEAARVPRPAVHHVLISHGHLDHARSAGALARSHGATVHCAERIMRNRSVRRSPRLAVLSVGRDTALESPRDLFHTDAGPLAYRAITLPHDCDPTVAFRLEHEGRVMVVLTDMGTPRHEVAHALSGAHLLVLEFNHDASMLAAGPYSPSLKRRIGGGRGHLSNEQAAAMLDLLAGPELHTVVLAHLSETNNRPELALACARTALRDRGLEHVQVVVASQHEVGPNLRV